MSLLLDALKKAEKAKQEAQRRTRADGRTEPALAPAAAGEHVRTRDELPNISQSLEIKSEDLAPPQRAAEPPGAGPVLALELEPASPPKGSTAPQAPPPAASASAPDAGGSQSANRAAAKKVFEAKFREPNPRLPFYIALGFLGAFALGTVGYFWYQLRPAPALVNSSPHRPAGEATAAAAAPTTPTATGVAPAGAAAPAAISGLPGESTPSAKAAPAAAAPAAKAALPGTPPVTAAPAATRSAVAGPAASNPPPKPVPQAAAAQPAPRSAGLARRAAAPPRYPVPGPTPERRPPQVNPHVVAAYQAYQAGDLAVARADYARALAQEPMNRDALLGLAAIAMRTHHYGLAEGYYQRLLEANPRDPNAQAGYLALRSALVDPVDAESRVKTLLASDPQADVLYFTLGNEYAQQQRWGEARHAYLRALAADPDNPDFAYNAAVSFDHLGQHARALEYYRRALTLAASRAASFDAAAARTRVAQLSH